ncbi:TIR-like protein FxsC [Kitasatospora sp. NPDC048239]|uniref:TIR-like protein FxsC n=1 Tax=Kitasatospora sp. NPDC048239 TaxID=3364046 RepID=UPI00371D5082
MIARLLRALAEADAASAADLGPEELADILWLAGCLDDSGRDRPQQPAAPAAQDTPVDQDAAEDRTGDQGPDESADGPLEQHYATADLTAPGSPGGSGRPENPGEGAAARRGDLVRVARAGALADPLAVMRALRPLGRRTLADSRGEPELDEEATVSAGVDQRLLVPVLRPTPGRWLDLALVIDTHRSMTLWHNLVADLRRVVAQTGVFRDVRTWYLGGTEAGGTPSLAARPGGAPRRPQEIADPSGRRLVLVVTDTVGGGWGGPAVDNVLRGWGRHGSVALLNVLPERLWSRGSVRPTPLWLRATGPAAPNTGWEATATRPRGRTHRRLRADRPMPVPVVDASPSALGALAALVSGTGRRSRLSSLLVGDGASAPAAPPALPQSADLALKQFRETASPLARQLAGHLSVVPLVLPVMTLVRRVMLPQADHGHLAEVLLGGLLAPWQPPPPGGDPDALRFDFLPGVREALLAAQRRDEVAEIRSTVRHQVAAYLKARRAATADFTAARVTGQAGGRLVDGAALPFAESAEGGRAPAAAPSLADLITPLAFGVHMTAPQAEPEDASEDAPETPDGLGRYFERRHDERLRSLVREAADGRSRSVLLVGNAVTGMTRACYEALRQVPPHWRLHRIDRRQQLRPADVGPFGVIWLDDVQRLLLEGPQSERSAFARLLRELLDDEERRPVLLLGTMRASYVQHLSAGNESDGWSPVRALIAATELITVPDAFSEQEAELAVAFDGRLADAALLAGDGRIIQAMAGVPQLLERRRAAPPEVRAMLDAALAVGGLGYPPALSAELLRAGALAYLASEQRGAAWFAVALHDACRPIFGLPGLLVRRAHPSVDDSPQEGPRYLVNPVLTARHRRGPAAEAEPPDGLWSALVAHAAPHTREALALEADRRGLPAVAEALRQPAPVEEAAEEPAEEPVEVPTEAPADEPADEPADQPADQPAAEPAGRPAEQPEPEATVRTRSLPGSDAIPDQDLKPYFYLSHAHLVRGGPTGSPAATRWLEVFFDDLREAVLELVPTEWDAASVGFMDTSERLGTRWAGRNTRALASCRVFVPLYSPDYFANEVCGWEWYAFSRRPVYRVGTGERRATGIVPVLWEPLAEDAMPPVARQLVVTGQGARSDEEPGLLALIGSADSRPAYEVAVHRLASRIVRVAEETVIQTGRPLDLLSQPNAFEHPVAIRRAEDVHSLRVLVLSLAEDELPTGRRPGFYGSRRTGWNPYEPNAELSLGEYTARAVRRLGMDASVHEFEEEVRAVLDNDGPVNPALLLVDRWALRSQERLALLQLFLRLNPDAVVLLEPWNADDPDNASTDWPVNLRDLGLSLGLRRRTWYSRVRPFALRTLADFDAVVAPAMNAARRGFAAALAARPASPLRPSLREAFPEFPEPSGRDQRDG